MNDVTVWLLTTSTLFKVIAEHPATTIGRVLTLGKDVVLVEVVVRPYVTRSENVEGKNGQEWYQPKLPGMR